MLATPVPRSQLHRLSSVKTLAPYFTFCNFFRHLLPFPKHIFEWTRNGVVPYTLKNPKSR